MGKTWIHYHLVKRPFKRINTSLLHRININTLIPYFKHKIAYFNLRFLITSSTIMPNTKTAKPPTPITVYFNTKQIFTTLLQLNNLEKINSKITKILKYARCCEDSKPRHLVELFSFLNEVTTTSPIIINI